MNSSLSDKIKDKTGKTLVQFCKEDLNTAYPTFHHRFKEGKIHIKDFIYISLVTGLSLDQLIMEEPAYQDLIKALKEDPEKVFSQNKKRKNTRSESPTKTTTAKVDDDEDDDLFIEVNIKN